MSSFSSVIISDPLLETLSSKLEEIRQMPNDNNNDRSKETLLNELSEQIDSLPQNVPQTVFVKAGILEQLANLKRSNPMLERAIHLYRDILFQGPSVDDQLFKLAGDKCISLMKFRGWNAQSVRVWKMLIQRFESDPQYRRQLGVTYLTIGNNKAGKEVFEELIRLHPNDFFAKAHLGFVEKSDALNENDQDKLKRAADLMNDGIKSDSNYQLEGLFYFHLGDAYRRLGQDKYSDEIYRLAADRGIFRSFWQRSLYNEPDLKAQPVWTLEETLLGPQLKDIRSKWWQIRNEALAVLRLDAKTGGFVNETENLRDTGDWTQFDLFVRGQKKIENCAKAPLTCSLIEAIPEVRHNRRGQVKFSVMKSGTHVHPHSGPTNCRLRAHLGLQIPKVNKQLTEGPAKSNSTVLRVADQYLHWADGKMFVFDDSFDHEVWHYNESNEPRVVLILDLWHPDLSAEKRASLPAI